jgi:predicted RNase H-like nuclease
VNPEIPDPKERYVKACAVARATSADNKAFSKQGFGLFPKIVQIDRLLSAQKLFLRRVFETHPELAFRQLNGAALRESKKSDAGLEARRRLLLGAKLPAAVVSGAPPKGAAYDDLLDALACAVVARRINERSARSFPDRPKRDSFGLPMAIWA